MAVGDMYKKRLKIDTSNIENSLVQIAWDVYSADNSFDDIYTDNFTTDDGIDGTVESDTSLSGNSTGIYDSGNSLFKSGTLVVDTTTDYTSAQIDCSAWSDIDSVAITQTTPGDATVGIIYHAISFDNAVTYKVFKTTWLTVAYNAGTQQSPTWQYNNAGTLTNASTNSLAGAMAQSTVQSAYQWTKTNIEAMSDADWNETGGWSISVNTIDWTYRAVDGVSWVTSSTTNATPTLSSNTSASPFIVTRTSMTTTYDAYRAFDKTQSTDDTKAWFSGAKPTSGAPQSLMVDWGSGNAKLILRYGLLTRDGDANIANPTAWKFQGSNTEGCAVDDAVNANGWTDLDTQTGVTSNNSQNYQWYSETLAHTTAYRYYRLRFTDANTASAYVVIAECSLIEATTATPTFTSATFTYDSNQEYTSTQIDCSAWTDINSVVVNQTTPTGTVSNSAIYHAISFDGTVTYKVFISSTWIPIAQYINGTTWQFNSNTGTGTTWVDAATAGSNTVASAMTQATTGIAGHQWTKTLIDAMSDSDWNVTGGWSTSVDTIDWTYTLVSGTSYETNGALNTSETYATTQMTSGTTGSATVTDSEHYGSTNLGWGCFDQSTAWWQCDETNVSSNIPRVMYDFGSGNSKAINKYRIKPGSANYAPTAWKLQGSNDAAAAVSDAETANGWTTLDTQTGQTTWTNGVFSSYYTFSNLTAYRKYRLRVTASVTNTGMYITEIHLVERTTSTVPPTFSSISFNRDIPTEPIPLSLISNSWEASVNDPTQAYCVLDVEPVDEIINNTDLKAYVSIDNGANYEQITLEGTPFREVDVHDYIRGDLAGITTRTDKTIRIKVTSENDKALKLHAWAIGVRY
jgi:hypothetical protein